MFVIIHAELDEYLVKYENGESEWGDEWMEVQKPPPNCESQDGISLETPVLLFKDKKEAEKIRKELKEAERKELMGGGDPDLDPGYPDIRIGEVKEIKAYVVTEEFVE